MLPKITDTNYLNVRLAEQPIAEQPIKAEQLNFPLIDVLALLVSFATAVVLAYSVYISKKNLENQTKNLEIARENLKAQKEVISVEIMLKFREKYDELVFKEKELNEDDFYRLFWELQLDQFVSWLKGYIAEDLFVSWMKCRHKEYLRDGIYGRKNYRKNYQKFKREFEPTQIFKEFMNLVFKDLLDESCLEVDDLEKQEIRETFLQKLLEKVKEKSQQQRIEKLLGQVFGGNIEL
jgi:hypothetical protein